MKLTKLFAVVTLLVATMGSALAESYPSYLKMDGSKVIGCDKDALPQNLVIPNGVTEINYEAFPKTKVIRK